MKKGVIWGGVVWLIVCALFCLFTVETKTPPLIRLHLLANSDSLEDQELKYKVRDELIKVMQKEFGESKSLTESRTILLRHLPDIEKRAEEYIAQEGYAYQVQAVYGKFSFPLRDYGAFILPAGKYEALRLIIGEGKGANWWCVLFPPLCFVEGEKSLCLESDFAEILEQSQREGKTIKLKPTLKVVEMWQKTFVKNK
jgi:stage II sporulation protein R